MHYYILILRVRDESKRIYIAKSVYKYGQTPLFVRKVMNGLINSDFISHQELGVDMFDDGYQSLDINLDGIYGKNGDLLEEDLIKLFPNITDVEIDATKLIVLASRDSCNQTFFCIFIQLKSILDKKHCKRSILSNVFHQNLLFALRRLKRNRD